MKRHCRVHTKRGTKTFLFEEPRNFSYAISNQKEYERKQDRGMIGVQVVKANHTIL